MLSSLGSVLESNHQDLVKYIVLICASHIRNLNLKYNVSSAVSCRVATCLGRNDGSRSWGGTAFIHAFIHTL